MTGALHEARQELIKKYADAIDDLDCRGAAQRTLDRLEEIGKEDLLRLPATASFNLGQRPMEILHFPTAYRGVLSCMGIPNPGLLG